ncbi:flavin-dependent monooxygenase QhpG [Azohydromonas lata]|uniref:Lycopene cyclase family protein n=1 Tax=Azohydromonas lata TaxID=45677 RepID=A0ABU5IAS6_9BURK|nr:lycopene cyclase family protein [Azohydromonas lata]MDZ5456197.1 lycopene cyclase family protein [Azohydromonas lata]
MTTTTVSPIALLGAGPAALALAIALRRAGLQPLVLGRPRPRPATEGLSWRVAQGFEQLGCRTALSLLKAPWRRVSAWAGTTVEMNGEFVVERQALDAALWEDARRAGVALQPALVREVEHRGEGGWRIHWEDARGGSHVTRAGFVVESRGRGAPKWAADQAAAAPRVALCRAFTGARRGRRTTFTESFEHGWAWGTLDAAGAAQVQLVLHPDTLKAHGGDVDAAHAAGMHQLPMCTALLGPSLQPAGGTAVRGIQAVLRGGTCLEDGLRLGDAAYGSDPLSGHGMFEAVSGALAAAPTLRTLLERPADAQAAREFYAARAREVFAQRLQAARAHYAGETRWPHAPFWQALQAGAAALVPVAQPQAAAIAARPVVENGFIVRRRVVLAPGHPRGVRFIDGVDLPALHDALRGGAPDPSMETLAAQLHQPPGAVHGALRWLQAQRLA